MNVTASVLGLSDHGGGLAFSGIVGYRYQAPDGGFVFRIDFTPIVAFGTFLPFGGISAGYGF